MRPVWVPGCHVRLRQSASGVAFDSRLECVNTELVGLAKELLFVDATELGAPEGNGLMYEAG